MSYCTSMSKSKFFVSSKYTGLVLAKMKNYPYHFDLDDTGNIVGIKFKGIKLSDEFAKFQSIACYVKDGSFIEISGEEGAKWRWIFKDNQCREIKAQISWSNETV